MPRLRLRVQFPTWAVWRAAARGLFRCAECGRLSNREMAGTRARSASGRLHEACWRHDRKARTDDLRARALR